jgi:hypothetical protein
LKRFSGGLLKLPSVELVNVAGTCIAEESAPLVAMLLLALAVEVVEVLVLIEFVVTELC